MDLERELGVTLMRWGKNGLTLTGEGVFFRQRAREIVELADRLEKSFAEGQSDIGGMVVIGASDATKYDCVRLSRQDTWGLLVRDASRC